MKACLKFTLAIVVLMVTIVACNILELDNNVQSNGKHVSKMVFNGSVAGYEGTTVRDAKTKGTESWSEGDIVYIAFHNGDAIIPGTAVFSPTDGWSVSYDGDLAEGTSQQCEVRFFVNPTFANENLVTLNSNTEIYEDAAGSFDFSDGVISVTASLTPKVGRIRFTGTTGDRIHITGITTNTTFSPAGNLFSTTTAMVHLDVEDSGSTPYVYGFFTYEDRKIGIVGSDFAYTRTCGSAVFQTGDSGYMKIPSKTSHNNWKNGLIVTVNGVDFKMLPVTGFSGGFFLLAETETTTAQYYAVRGGSTTSSNYPFITYYGSDANGWASFINKINYKTSLLFYMPLLEEWQYAASGGSLSQGYTYSGSNNPGDVAWYGANSGNALHEVKMLAPNELGLYDMSGNAAEWTRRTSSSKWALAGGDYSGYAITPTSYSPTPFDFDYNLDNNAGGLRLALKCE